MGIQPQPLFKKDSFIEIIYLLIICIKGKFFLWNTSNTDINKQNTHSTHLEKDNTRKGGGVGLWFPTMIPAACEILNKGSKKWCRHLCELEIYH